MSMSNYQAEIEQLMAVIRANAFANATMGLTDAELRRAHAIKQAVLAGCTELEYPVVPLTDFEYAQYALFCPVNEPAQNILYRISMLQAFKREFNIEDTVDQGIEFLEQGTELMPAFLLNMSYLPSSQNFVSVEDWSKFYPSLLQNNEAGFRTFLGLLYYKSKAKEPHFQGIRNGVSTVVECSGMTTEVNSDMALLERILHSFWRWYPCKHRESFFMNSPSLISVWCGYFKKYLPFGPPRTMKVGMQVPGLEGERIDQFYKRPDAVTARQNMLMKAKGFLELRYYNEQTYTLPAIPVVGGP